MLVSVIIPSYNRPDSVIRLLDNLNAQSLSPQSFEVIVVDDGSLYDEKVITSKHRPFHLVFIRQDNQGATIARNNGAVQSRGEVLVFIDDDVTISPTTLEALYLACVTNENILATGRLIQRSPVDTSIFAQLASENVNNLQENEDNHLSDEFLLFTFCNTQLLAVKKEDFITLGMMQDPNRWHYWDDVYLGYRAHLAGMHLLSCGKAQGIHWDISLVSLNQACQRWFRASKSAVRLFDLYPEMQPYLPMFHDKIPISWDIDPPSLIIRKSVRRVASGTLSIKLMESIVRILERYFPYPNVLESFYRWIQGGYMFMGYSEGLKEFK